MKGKGFIKALLTVASIVSFGKVIYDAGKAAVAAKPDVDKRKEANYDHKLHKEDYIDIGKKYYKNPNEDPAALKVLCDDIDTRRRRIKKMRYELNQIRGYKECPKCGAEVNDRFQFCGRCGARLPDMDDDDFMSLEPNDYYTESSNNFFNADSNKNY